MREELFRREVISNSSDQWFGKIKLAAPVSHSVWAICAISGALILLAWMVFGSYTRRERVLGVVVPERGLSTLRAPVTGDAFQVLIKDGDRVRVGQPLIIVGSEQYSGDEQSVEGKIKQDLQVQAKALEREVDTARTQARRTRENLLLQIGLIQQQIVQSSEQIEIASANAAEQKALLDRMSQLLEKSYISGFEVQRQRSILADALANASRLIADRASGERQLQELKGRLEQASLDLEASVNQADLQLARNSVELSKNEADRRSVVRAMTNGVVTTLMVQPGQSLVEGQLLMKIVPEGSKMQVEVLVSSSAIGFIVPRQSVSLRFRAFPFQKFGAKSGKVQAISESTLSPDDIANLYGIKGVEESMYRVRISDVPQHIVFDATQRPVMPGMLVDADIMVEQRRIYEWLLGPLYSLHRDSSSLAELAPTQVETPITLGTEMRSKQMPAVIGGR